MSEFTKGEREYMGSIRANEEHMKSQCAMPLDKRQLSKPKLLMMIAKLRRDANRLQVLHDSLPTKLSDEVDETMFNIIDGKFFHALEE